MRIHRICTVLIGFLILLALAGCRAPAGGDPLGGTSWALTSISGAPPLPGRTISLAFENGEVRGSAGCNTYFGTYTVDGTSLTIGDLMWTEMACVEPEWMAQEAAYLAILANVSSFSLGDGRLDLLSSDAQTLAFTPAG